MNRIKRLYVSYHGRKVGTMALYKEHDKVKLCVYEPGQGWNEAVKYRHKIPYDIGIWFYPNYNPVSQFAHFPLYRCQGHCFPVPRMPVSLNA